MKRYTILLFVLALLGCKGGKGKVDVSGVDLNVEMIRFDQDLFNISPDTAAIRVELPRLRQTYGSFFELYNQNIINIGNSFSELYPVYLNLFLTNEAVQTGWQAAKVVFADVNELNKQLTDAFKQFKYYFPQKYVPQIYTYISGFGESIALADSLIGVSLDKYLGADFKGYDMLGISRYLSSKMYKEKIPSDCIRAWGVGEFPLTDDGGNNLISKMVYEGKLIYFTKMMMPNEADTVIFGFTKQQLDWCKDNEKNMWAFLIEQKKLFSTDRMTIIKMTEDAPFTQSFPPESPGKACNWIGYRIVLQYMKRDSDITLPQLMENNNHQKIFEKSKYKP